MNPVQRFCLHPSIEFLIFTWGGVGFSNNAGWPQMLPPRVWMRLNIYDVRIRISKKRRPDCLIWRHRLFRPKDSFPGGWSRSRFLTQEIASLSGGRRVFARVVNHGSMLANSLQRRHCLRLARLGLLLKRGFFHRNRWV